MLIDSTIFADPRLDASVDAEGDEDEQEVEAQKEAGHTEVLEEDEEEATCLPDEGEVVL